MQVWIEEVVAECSVSKPVIKNALPTTAISIVESVFPFVHAPEYEFITSNQNLKARFTDASPECAVKFRSSLEFAFNEFPSYNGFSVACEVFQLALEVKKGSVPPLQSPNKREGEEISGDREK